MFDPKPCVYCNPHRNLSEAHRLAIQFLRQDLDPLSPISVLDIGVGSGAVAKRLREAFPRLTIEGVDKADLYLDASKNYYNRLHSCPIEDLHSDRVYDVIVLLDVLEHLENPRQTLLHLKRRYLKKSGVVLISIPNVAHWAIRLQLLRGRFRYTERGIMDATHLRFFTLETYRELIRSCELDIVYMAYTAPIGPIDVYKRFPFTLLPEGAKRHFIHQLANWLPQLFAVQFVSLNRAMLT